MSVRVYLAAGVEGVRALRDTGEVIAPAFVVTDEARAADPRADEEDLEYEASLAAEEWCREVGTGVAVLAADVPAAVVPRSGGPRVEVGAVPVSAVVSVHVAEKGAAEDEELLWYDVSELDDVLAYLAE